MAALQRDQESTAPGDATLPTPAMRSPEMYEQAILDEIGRELLVSNITDVALWNNRVLDMLPTDEVSLEVLRRPFGNAWSVPLMNSEHPSIVAKAQEITAGLESDLERARAINDWISANIYYDINLSEGWFGEGREDYNNSRMVASTVLELRRSVSSGTQLFTITMLRAAGIPTVHITSHFLDVSIYFGAGWEGMIGELHTVRDYINAELPSNQLAAAFVDGRWIFIDTHWDGNAGHYHNGVFTTGSPPKGLYFDFSIEFMSEERIMRVPLLP